MKLKMKRVEFTALISSQSKSHTVHPAASSDLPDNEMDRVVVVFPLWRKQWSRWCFSWGRNNGRGGVSHGGRNGWCNRIGAVTCCMAAVVFLTGEKRVVQQDRGQSHVANMCVGDAIKIPAVVKERGGDNPQRSEEPNNGHT